MKAWRKVLVLVTAAVLGRAAPAQVRRIRPRPLLTIPGTLGVSATPSTVSFTLANGGVAPGSQGVSIATGWLITVAATIQLYGYFVSTTAFTQSGSTSTIPSANVFGQCSTGIPTSYTAFTGASPFSGSSALEIFSQANGISILSNRTDVLNLEVNLTTLPQLAAGSYTGTLVLQAVAF